MKFGTLVEIVDPEIASTSAFKRWFLGSKVVNDSGKPLLVYHGAGRPLEGRLTARRAGSHTDPGLYGAGLYFTSHKGAAKGWSRDRGPVVAAYLRIKSPLVYDAKTHSRMMRDPKWYKLVHDMQGKRMTTYLRNRGYDGVIVPEHDEFVVFDDDQVMEVDREEPSITV